MATIEYFYSTRSIYTYFGAARLSALARRFGRRIEHKPIDLSVVIPGTGGTPFAERGKARQAYFFGREIERWSQYLGLPTLVDPKHHHGDRTLSSGIVLAAAENCRAMPPTGCRSASWRPYGGTTATSPTPSCWPS